MKRIVPIEKTFAVMRMLPAEIEFNTVQQFIIQHPVIPSNPYFNFINLQNFLPMIAITSLLTVALLMSRTPRESAPATAIKSEPMPPAIEAPLFIPADSTKKEPVRIIPEKKASVVSVASSSGAKTSSASQAMAVSASVFATDSTVVSVTVNNCDQSVSSTDGVRTTASSKCDCNFGGDDEWIDEIVKELLKEKLIADGCDFMFKLTANAFYVNGKEISDKGFASKMMDMYKASTGKRLHNEDDYISVKVTEESCSLSKNIND